MNQPARQPAPRTAAEATARPELFHDVYWATNDRNPPPDIIRARNRFAIDWKLKSRYRVYAPVPPKGWPYGCDHPETYTDAEGWIVLLVSNDYGQPPPILGLRFVGYLYEGKVRSYAGRFASLRELRARLEAVEGAPKFGAGATYSASRPRPAGAHGRGGADSRYRPRSRRAREPHRGRGGIPHPPRLRA